ncbi:MAG: hypothetical protein CVU41_13330 [Chloroflexi bacterium HGW-Chloroflexi-3]|nr:MAG: hypothetical protein CVU41_13330 [Chloroflexi bacterium HGW-Chloroflexi-3]
MENFNVEHKKFLDEILLNIPFQPFGKPRMKEGIQIDLLQSEDYLKYQFVFEEAIQYSLILQSCGI